MFFKVSDLQPGVTKLMETGVQPGKYIGFTTLKDLISVKLGYTTYIVGAPYSGKSEFLFEILINLSSYYGWRHAIFSPESGSKEEIVAELCHKYVGKPFYNTHGNVMSEAEMYRALQWLDQYFFIVDPEEKDLTIPQFYEQVEKIEKLYGVTIQTTTGDPFNEFKHDFSADQGRQDLYIERILGDVRKNAKKHNRHNFIVTHCRDQQPITKDGHTFFPPPTARDYAGGQAWFRKGMQMICVYRPPEGMNDENGMPFADNETLIIVQKSKPKGIGKKGKAKIFFDWKKSRYYETIHGADCYARPEGSEVQAPLTPNTQFDNNREDFPF